MFVVSIMLDGFLSRFRRSDSGGVLAEGMIVFPVMILFTFGMLEFGSVLWHREQVQTGVRDAARYWSRCRQSAGDYTTGCSEQIARNIAFYGTPSPIVGTTTLRVPGWDGSPVTELVITPEKSALPTSPEIDDVVQVTGQLSYQGFLYLRGKPIRYRAEMGFVGW
ncbi:Flp pilus assembly protein TadG [Tritonibacter multivorans]|uniref:Flp pilus assembly protein TadG n=2 Tax=Tritonibacter multivorans TaxID=928856 RepID=A0A0N7LYH9_9RHOB|nr:Flp pilus assembly protein TadG [Tritonibacter multivorans]SFD43567.1 Flp pilus assembly protein TadG [Tritonibacter multivorans]